MACRVTAVAVELGVVAVVAGVVGASESVAQFLLSHRTSIGHRESTSHAVLLGTALSWNRLQSQQTEQRLIHHNLECLSRSAAACGSKVLKRSFPEIVWISREHGEPHNQYPSNEQSSMQTKHTRTHV